MKTKGSLEKNNHDKTNEISLDYSNISAFLRKHYILIFLLIFMIFGFYLRSYHMDFPVIGYHNMKENQYLPYTEFMYNADDFLDYFRTETYWIGTQEHGYFTQYEFPLIPWLILVLWLIFGVKLWAARLVIILFSVASIPVLYLVGRKLTDNKFILLTTCLFFAIMPINIFFGRNVQPEAPGLFFILFAWYWFFCWIDNLEWKSFIYFSVSLLLAILLKIPNGIGLVPLLFFIPYRKLWNEKKNYSKYALVFLGFMAIFPIWVKFSKWVMPGAATVGTSGFSESFTEVWHNILRTFTSQYWIEYFPALKAFFLDNFTIWFFWLLVFGIIFAFIKSKTKLGLFIIGSFFSVFVYVMAFADKIRGHAYYQMVFVPLVCLAGAYTLYIISQFLHKLIFIIFKKDFFKKIIPLVILLVFLFLAYPAMETATARVFDTIFYGEDVAGDFIYQNSDQSERVFIDGVFSQSVGILWHAHRYGTDEITSNLTEFKRLETDLNFKWVVLYSYGINTIQSKQEVWDYIQNNYKIKQIGLIVQDGQYVPYYFVLEKGGVFDFTAFQNKTSYLAQTYTTTNGDIQFYAVDDTN